ncbi:MAG: hypothetical protein M9905_06335 [Rhizobiaceae bacterium]|nr:hypothetical protein [Rhizobiaceae bacterium]
MTYRTLDPAHIIETARRLERRVDERFPDAGLAKVARELVSLSRDLSLRARELEQPIWWLRIVIASIIAAGATVFIFVGTVLPFERISTNAFESVEGIEASLNTILLAGIGFLALVRYEERIKRKRVFRALHGLRSLIHVIDMHQLTKDPAILTAPLKPTPSSPARTMSAPELSRYLDYCSEMLSITGKVAALFAQSVNDEVVIDAVNDIEELATNLSRKIWQKIMILDERALHAR